MHSQKKSFSRFFCDANVQYEWTYNNCRSAKVPVAGAVEGVRDWSDHLNKTPAIQLLVRSKF